MKLFVITFLTFLFSVQCFSQNTELSVNDSQKNEKVSEIISQDSKLCFNPEKRKPKLKSYKNYKKKMERKYFFMIAVLFRFIK